MEERAGERRRLYALTSEQGKRMDLRNLLRVPPLFNPSPRRRSGREREKNRAAIYIVGSLRKKTFPTRRLGVSAVKKVLALNPRFVTP
jgi:hypothetical protein